MKLNIGSIKCKITLLFIFQKSATMKPEQAPRIAFFSTCLVDQGFPEVGQAAVKMLRRVGYKVEYPKKQTCCGHRISNA